MLLATPENMEKCKDIPGVVAFDLKSGDTFSADRGDYWDQPASEPIHGEECMILVVKVCKWVDPITREDISAQLDTEIQNNMSLDDALGQGRN
jgi:hypothetical protein